MFFFQAEDGIRDIGVTGVQTCALPISVQPDDGGRVPVGPGGELLADPRGLPGGGVGEAVAEGLRAGAMLLAGGSRLGAESALPAQRPSLALAGPRLDRTSAVSGKSVELGGCRSSKKTSL